VEAEWLEDARRTDIRYHLAKLIAAAFNEPERIWSEHDDVRRALLAAGSPTSATPARSFDDVVAIHRRLVAVGLIKQS
jgi:hypothetical protein